jgi:hypothetical protein
VYDLSLVLGCRRVADCDPDDPAAGKRGIRGDNPALVSQIGIGVWLPSAIRRVGFAVADKLLGGGLRFGLGLGAPCRLHAFTAELCRH